MDKLVPFNEIQPLSRLVIEETVPLRRLLEDARVAIEILNYEVKSLPSAAILLDTLALQEAKVSSNIENIVTTNDELYRGLVFDSLGPEAKEVTSYKEALFTGFNRLNTKGILTISDLEAINQFVNNKQHGIRPNLPQFKSSLTRIANVTDGVTEIVYTPPHGKELLHQLLVDMLEFVYNDEVYPLHPLIKIALAHYQFESIHPFYDGNGRTGRILNVLLLCYKGYLSYPILYTSSFIIKHKTEYYQLLQQCRVSEDYTGFIVYMLNSFKSTAEQTLRLVNDIKTLVSKYTDEEFIISIKGQKRLLVMVMEVLFKKVYVRIDDLVALGMHRQTAATYLKQLVEQGLLEEEKVHRDKIFKNVELLALFEGE